MKESKIIENESTNLFGLKSKKNGINIEKYLSKNSNTFKEENDKDNRSEDILNTGFYLDCNDKELKDINKELTMSAIKYDYSK